jgi:hypothetical protein
MLPSRQVARTVLDQPNDQNCQHMALPLQDLPTTPAKREHRPPRERISQKTRRRARELEQRLRFLQDEFNESEFSTLLDEAVKSAHQIAESSRKKDRDQVLFAIEQTQAHTIEEIMEDSRLSYWVVYSILQEFINLRIVELKLQRDPAKVNLKPVYLYFLTHTPAGTSLQLDQHPVKPRRAAGSSFDEDE